MGWKGIAFGAWIGSLFGGPLGALLGAALGHQVEKRITGGSSPRRTSGPSARNRAMVFCASAAAMLAKMAKADGRVTADEIASVEQAFARLGFDRTARDYAVNVFRRAKDDGHSIYEYAQEFAAAIDSVEVREFFYGLLWDLARADGVVSAAERAILRRIPPYLGISPGWYDLHAGGSGYGGSAGGSAASSRDTLAEAYRTLGVASTASDDEVRRAYRELAKKNHPDLLRAQGLPEEMVGKATEKMGRINDAWSTVREARKMKG